MKRKLLCNMSGKTLDMAMPMSMMCCAYFAKTDRFALIKSRTAG